MAMWPGQYPASKEQHLNIYKARASTLQPMVFKLVTSREVTSLNFTLHQTPKNAENISSPNPHSTVAEISAHSDSR